MIYILGYRLQTQRERFFGDHFDRMKKKADKYVYAILNLRRDLFDCSVVARSLWEVCAVPAVMYGSESCVVTKGLLGDLKEKQRVIAAFVVGLPRKGGNMEAKYHVGVHRVFNRLLDSSSDLMYEALQEHRNSVLGSP